MIEDKIIDIITDETLNLESKKINNPIIRYASRGIVFNELGEIAVINKKAKNEYKLPGGGIENLETKEEAFYREIFEETGCKVKILDYLGIIIEEKGLTNFKQISYVFVAEVLEDTKKLHLTIKETEEKTTLLWKNIVDAYQLIKNSQENLVGSKYDSLYKSLFMVLRDQLILDYYLKNKEKNS